MEIDLIRKQFNEQVKIERIENEIKVLLQNSDFVLCIHDNTSTKYALTKVYVNHLHDGRKHELLRFNQYEENGEVKQLTNNLTGLIHYIFDQQQFNEMANPSMDGETFQLKVPFSFA